MRVTGPRDWSGRWRDGSGRRLIVPALRWFALRFPDPPHRTGHRQALAMHPLDLAQLGDNVFRLLSRSSHPVVRLFAEILPDIAHRGWTPSKALAQLRSPAAEGRSAEGSGGLASALCEEAVEIGRVGKACQMRDLGNRAFGEEQIALRLDQDTLVQQA